MDRDRDRLGDGDLARDVDLRNPSYQRHFMVVKMSQIATKLMLS